MTRISYDILQFLLLSYIFIGIFANQPLRSAISIRGHPQAQQLPISHTKFWDIYTYDFHTLKLVENEKEENGWIYPTSYDTLYLPSDLPRPIIEPALGVVLIHGTPRYIMPSIITTLQTPDKIWRNRGVCSLPRSYAWIDLFAPFTPSLTNLKMSIFEKVAPNVRFLEDQDGTTAWDSMIQPLDQNKNTINREKITLFRPMDENISQDEYCLDVSETFQRFQSELQSNVILEPLKHEGFRIVDIPLPYKKEFKRMLSSRGEQIKAFLTDFLEPERLLEIEDSNILESEPCAQLDIRLISVGEGRSSKFIPQVYKELYEEGAVLFSQ